MGLLAGILLLLLLLLGKVELYRRRGLQNLSYSCRFSHQEMTEGEALTFIEELRNGKSLPVPWLKAELTVSKWLEFSEAHSAVTDNDRFVTSFFSLRGQAKVRREWQIVCRKRGIYQVEHVVVVTSDLLGGVRLSMGAADTGGNVTVLPKRFTGAGLLLPQLLQYRPGESTVRQSFFSDPCLCSGIRDYVPGDSVRSIAWKASARAGTLFVRQEQPTAQKSMTLLLSLETNPADSGLATQDLPLLEHTIRVCAQCLWELCRDGWQVRLCVGAQNASRTSELMRTSWGGGAGWYHRALCLLAAVDAAHVVPVQQLLRERNHVSKVERLLLVTPCTDRRIAVWKSSTGGLVLVTGHAHDGAHCADLIVPQQANSEGSDRI